ncbi:hypothetical protein [Adhaeribacter aquaticus]|nr:hypothetical protein [Adhaeribacter aquaticus]
MSHVWIRQPISSSTRKALKKAAKQNGFPTVTAFLRHLIHKAIRDSE